MSEQPTRITVRGAAPYDVVVGSGHLGELPGLIGTDAQRIAVSHPGALRATADAVRDDLAEQGFKAHAVEVPDAEDAKTAEVAAYCWSVLGRIGMTRSDAIVGIGGGASTDLAGFVAATILEGYNYRVLSAASGPEAIEIWNSHKDEIAMLFTDIVMPHGLSGIDIGEKFFQEKPSLKIIYTSGYRLDAIPRSMKIKDAVRDLEHG
jgi:hypothetical protein